MLVIRILNSNKPCWVAEFEDGDPPRTLVLRNAQQFNSHGAAEDRIVEVRETHPLKEMSYDIELF